MSRNETAEFREDLMQKVLDETYQKAIFELLVKLQDEGLNVHQSREQVATMEELSIEQIKEIERAGLIHNWPPLD